MQQSPRGRRDQIGGVYWNQGIEPGVLGVGNSKAIQGSWDAPWPVEEEREVDEQGSSPQPLLHLEQFSFICYIY